MMLRYWRARHESACHRADERELLVAFDELLVLRPALEQAALLPFHLILERSLTRQRGVALGYQFCNLDL